VDPLMVAGGIGKSVDALLRNLEPVAQVDFLAYPPLEIIEHVLLRHDSFPFCPARTASSLRGHRRERLPRQRHDVVAPQKAAG